MRCQWLKCATCEMSSGVLPVILGVQLCYLSGQGSGVLHEVRGSGMSRDVRG